jgi:hypothetical protein
MNSMQEIYNSKSLFPSLAMAGFVALIPVGCGLLLTSHPEPSTLIVGIPILILLVWMAGLVIEDACCKTLLWIKFDEEVSWRTLTRTYSRPWSDLLYVAFILDAEKDDDNRVGQIQIVTGTGQEFHLPAHVDDWQLLHSLVQQRNDSLLVKKATTSLRRPIELLITSGFVLMLSAYVWYCKAVGVYESLFVGVISSQKQRIVFLYLLPYALPLCGIALGLFAIHRIRAIYQLRKKNA